MIRTLFYICLVGCFLCVNLGCEAFAKKFVRKPKKNEQSIEIVLEPREYPESPLPNEDLYRQRFTFWKYWQDELINSLYLGGNRKKQIEAVNYSIEFLNSLKKLLSQEPSERIDLELAQLEKVKTCLGKAFISNDDLRRIKRQLEKQKFRIDRNFVFSNIERDLLSQ
ncbi:MAG: hypothetical protein P9L96_06490 [Candidatus Gygaella obscura]|nr:hypothetical protein [Candidatus Gygaella obscura]